MLWRCWCGMGPQRSPEPERGGTDAVVRPQATAPGVQDYPKGFLIGLFGDVDELHDTGGLVLYYDMYDVGV